MEVVLGLALLSRGLGFVEAVRRNEAALLAERIPVQPARRDGFRLRVDRGELGLRFRLPRRDETPLERDQFPARSGIATEQQGLTGQDVVAGR